MQKKKKKIATKQVRIKFDKKTWEWNCKKKLKTISNKTNSN